MQGGSFLAGAGKGAAISIITAGATYGIGAAFGHSVGTLGNELARAGAHGVVGGLSNLANKGNFWQGFAVSSVSSLTGSGMQAMGWDGNYLPFVTGLAGAGTSWAAGGDLMSGFNQGYGIGAFNHKGEQFIADDGTVGTLSSDDAVITPKGRNFSLPVFTNSFTKGMAQFGWRRSDGNRAHAGVDLYAPIGTDVYSITAGKIMRVAEFYRGTYAIEINHHSFVGRYAEIMPISGLYNFHF